MKIDRSKEAPDFSGERFVYAPSEMEIELEHIHRYILAAEICAGKTVLDAAAGSGYGSGILGQTARKVVGLEIDPDSVRYATETYGNERVSFVAGDVMKTGLPDESFDVIVSVETLEHVDNHQMMLREFSRLLKPDGVLIVSTPDKPVYNRHLAEPNPFHVSELSRGEFFELLRTWFPTVEFYGQRAVFGSLLTKPRDDWGGLWSFRRDVSTGTVQGRNIYDEAMYIVAVCGRDAVPKLTTSLYEGTIPQNALSSLIGGLADRDRTIATLVGNEKGDTAFAVIKSLLDRLTTLEIEREQLNAAGASTGADSLIEDIRSRIDRSVESVANAQIGFDQRLMALQAFFAHVSADSGKVIDAKIRKLNALLLAGNIRLGQLRTETANLGSMVRQLNLDNTRALMTDMASRLEAERQVVEELRRENGNLRAQYQAIIASHSWVITRPLRVLKRFFVRG